MSRQGSSDQGTWGSDTGRPAVGRRGNGGANPGQYEQRGTTAGQQGGGSGQPGQFAGRGPRGYRRGDDRIGSDVCEALTLDADIDASQIDVIVTDGVVTLIGVVDDRDTKRRAEDLVDRIPGVSDVNNQLHFGGQAGDEGRGDQGRSDQGRGDAGRGQPGRSQGRLEDRGGMQGGDFGARDLADRGGEAGRTGSGASAGR
jgi:hypothetical protein